MTEMSRDEARKQPGVLGGTDHEHCLHHTQTRLSAPPIHEYRCCWCGVDIGKATYDGAHGPYHPEKKQE